MPRAILFVLFSALFLTCRAVAQDGRVFGEGEQAPALRVGTWVRGEPVDRFERGRVYVVEFWASWCPASKRAIPRLTALQRAHPDGLTVVAVSSRDLQGESLARVETLASELGDAIGFRIGFDDGRRTARQWLDTFDVRSIPTAFVINGEGTIVWIGNPLWPPGEIEDATARVLAGAFTPADRESVHRIHLERRERIARVERELSDLDVTAQAAQALRLLDTLLEINPESAPSYTIKKFELMLSDPKRVDEAYALGRAAVAGVLKSDAERLAQLAQAILDEPGLERRDMDLALTAAARGVEITRRSDAEILDTLAMVYFRRGEPARAVEAEQRAVDLASDEYVKSNFEERLQEYQKAAREQK